MLTLFASVVLTGCNAGSPRSLAQQLIRDAKKHVKKAETLDAEAEKIGDEIEALPNTPEGDRRALELSKKLGKKTKGIKKEHKSAKALYQKGENLNASNDLKEYFRLETRAEESGIRLGGFLVQLTDLSLDITSKIINGTLTQEDFEDMENKFVKLNADIDNEDERYKNLKQEAKDFFLKKQLGEEINKNN